MRRSLLILALLISSATAALAQGVTIRGKVVTDSGRPLGAGEVSFFAATAAPAQPQLRAFTSAEGAFSIVLPAAGEYRVRVRHMGYEMIERTVTASDSTGPLSFGMSPSRGYEQHALAVSLARQRRERHDRLVAIARTRPRHWSCEQDPEEIRSQARKFLWLVPDPGEPADKSGDWRLPSDSAGFLRAAAPITNAKECARVARAFDKALGMENDHLVAIRIGNRYLFPTFGEYGASAPLSLSPILPFIFLD